VYTKEIDECSRYIMALSKTFEFPVNSTSVIFIGETPEGQPVPNKMKVIPILQFRWVKKHYSELKYRLSML
jgi:hypothetical protein|tara:strand:- start:52 stop:264 length:213 start_codon:yes stop_codon:yes gene_type:complete